MVGSVVNAHSLTGDGNIRMPSSVVRARVMRVIVKRSVVTVHVMKFATQSRRGAL
jgi:hypothetical protein